MKKSLGLALLVALTMMVMSCASSPSSSVSTGGGGSNPQAAVFMTGEDAPLASVVSFNVTLNSVTLNGKDGTTATVISSSNPTTVDFARLIGLRSPLSFNSVKPDTYISATFVMANPVIDYVDMQSTPLPTVSTINGTFPNNQSPYSLTVSFPTNMVVSSNGLAGLKMEMDIRQSLATDGNGNLVITNNTIAVNPMIYIKATHASDPDGQVTDLTGGLVSVNAPSSFVIQGPYGHQLTVDVNNDTQFNSGWSINNLATPAIIGVQGYFQADGTLMAQGVEVITTSQSFVSGRILALNSDGSGGTNITMWVGETGADMVSDVDTIQTIDVPSTVTNYEICFFENALTEFVFDGPSDLIVGQRIFIGGSYSDGTFTPEMISLRHQGVYGMLNVGSVTVTNGNAGVFTIANNGLVGYSTGGTVTVDTFNATAFFNLTGLSQLQSETTAIPIEARGLFLKDPTTGNPTFYAGLVSTPPTSTSK